MHDHSSFFESVVVQSFLVVSFVFSMMLLVEFLNYCTLGKWKKIVFKNKFSEYVFCALLGLSPGCLGAFFVVTLFSHGVVGLGALTAVMIATSGDESFIMLSLIPKHYFYLSLILFLTALIFGAIVDFFIKNKNKSFCEMPVDDKCRMFFSFKFNKTKSIFLSVYALIIILIGFLIDNEVEGYIILAANISSLALLSLTHEHFISDHIWKHLIKKHLFNLALWTVGSFFILNILLKNINLEAIIASNAAPMMFFSGLLGLIPQSGPHIIFTQMFAKSIIPFSVLVCNSISQDGHAGIPLIAESKKAFVIVKLVNLFAALLIGFTMLMFNI